MKMVNGESIAFTINGHDPGCESVTYNASWNDRVSSFKVTPGCRLTLWEHVNARGIRFDKPGSDKSVGGRVNDKASDPPASASEPVSGFRSARAARIASPS